MNLKKIRSLVADDMTAIEQLLQERLRSEVALADRIARYIVESGGKRLRAILVLLCGHALGGLRRPEDSRLLAAVIEFIHTATLLHDDVVDASDMRRGRDTVNRIWDNEASVLVGDFFYSRAFGMIAEINHPQITQILAEASTAIAEGELLELMHAGQTDLAEEQYLTIIEGKTARLFEASCATAACLENAPEDRVQELADYGRLLGAAFQIADDAIDYLEGNPEADKSVGDDLASGRMTLPLIYALRCADPEDQEFLRQTLKNRERQHIAEVCNIMRRCGAIDYTRNQAEDFSKRAQACLSHLEDSAWREALFQVADFCVSRKY